MNIEEAKKLIDKQSIGKGGVGDIPVVKTHIVKVLLDQLIQPKPEVPQFVADWIEEQKKILNSSAIDMYETLKVDNENGFYPDVWLWVNSNHVQFINAWTYGYEIEKEKLYTVDLPNGQPLVRGKNTLYFSQNLAAENARLTESEIRKDFDWAWQFRKDVTNE